MSGRSAYRSLTVHGELEQAEQRRAMLAAQAEQLRERRRPPLSTVAELLEMWVADAHDWKPSTWRNYRQAVRRISLTGLAGRRPDAVSPPVLRAALQDWVRSGVAASTVALHVRTLKAALGWAFDERLIACQPLIGWRGPGPSPPRRDVPVAIVRALLVAAHDEVVEARQAVLGRRELHRLHIAEQVELLLRLAADSGARRGELDALREHDLTGRVLTLEHGVSDEVLTTTKTGRSRRVTLGATSMALWHECRDRWQDRLPAGARLGPWVFSADLDHAERVRCDRLGHWFAAFTSRHGQPDVCLHRLRHTVATTLVADGQLLQAQQRLGHADASTTLRQYCHALPLRDIDVADHLDELYR